MVTNEDAISHDSACRPWARQGAQAGNAGAHFARFAHITPLQFDTSERGPEPGFMRGKVAYKSRRVHMPGFERHATLILPEHPRAKPGILRPAAPKNKPPTG